MADEPYTTLGISRTATAKQIRAAFLKLAKTHPDLNPGDHKAEERFKATDTANDLLSDSDRRARFDRVRSMPRAMKRRRRVRMPARAATVAMRRDPAARDMGPVLVPMTSAISAISFPACSEAEAEKGARRESLDRHNTLAVSSLDAVRGTTRRRLLRLRSAMAETVPLLLQLDILEALSVTARPVGEGRARPWFV